MSTKVDFAVIPAAGLGTRFLPATKSVPKELLPLVDKPSILYVVDEAINSGISQIVLVTSRQKTAVEDFFKPNAALETFLKEKNQLDLLKQVQDIGKKAKFHFVYQDDPHGLGHAVGCAESIIKKNPFAVLLGDEITIGTPTVTTQLINAFQEFGQSAVAIMEVPLEETKKYGIVVTKPLREATFEIQSIVEKPEPSKAPSRFALPGRYVFDAEIFEQIRQTPAGKNGEIQLTDAMVRLKNKKGLLGVTFKNKRFDAGDKLGFLKANIELGLMHSEIGADLKEYLKQLTKTL